jgi:hypothetical protein
MAKKKTLSVKRRSFEAMALRIHKAKTIPNKRKKAKAFNPREVE